MTRLTTLLLILSLTGVAACRPAASQPGESLDLPLLQRWQGDYPVAELGRLPVGQRDVRNGYLGTADAFGAVWSAFDPQKTQPEIDFTRNLVLFTRNLRFYNRTSIIKVTLTDGTAEILAPATMSARPVEDRVGMALAVVPRAGIKAVRVDAGHRITVE